MAIHVQTSTESQTTRPLRIEASTLNHSGTKSDHVRIGGGCPPYGFQEDKEPAWIGLNVIALTVGVLISVKAVQLERITIQVPEAPDEVPSVGTVAVTQGGTRKGYTVLGSVMGLQRSFRQRSLHAIWVSLRSAKKKEVPECWTEPID
ncbi:hypothetical protein F5890DRAFT_1589615 [Lentinula detonsa]|uniref:Uncharacterized protein n=1 Tax=Lentinula detonsa TaxID=2804962 RepID=A0AA38UL08_9AGAR|nr:hypothetical protein F5890DRAFT_1589615 [Lentinula detonsa]